MSSEYEALTQGAQYCCQPPNDGRDPMRNRPLTSNGRYAMITRYGFGRHYENLVGTPAIIERADGEYVLFADHEQLRAAFDTHNEMLIARLRAADERNTEYARILDGLPQDAIDGGWTAKGISDYAKRLEAERDRLREAMATIEAWEVPLVESRGEAVSMSLEYGSNGVRDYFRGIARAALTPQEQENDNK